MYSMLDPIQTKLLKEMLPEVINSSLPLEYNTYQKLLSWTLLNLSLKNTQLDPREQAHAESPFSAKKYWKTSQLCSFLERNGICEDF